LNAYNFTLACLTNEFWFVKEDINVGFSKMRIKYSGKYLVDRIDCAMK